MPLIRQTDKNINIMLSDEQYIQNKFGKEQPFAVPQGYFDNLQETIMKSVSLQQRHVQQSWWHRYRKVVAVAACVAMLVCGLSVYMAKSNGNNVQTLAASSVNTDTKEQATSNDDEAMEYSMLDNDDMYSLMANN